ncbi:acyl-CoA dehydrogenase family protein [Micromonospora sp. DT229]|uniref:acyl-CoA dehydrogenase family protein n=1 Tax=Micromonospora sp. DT229 TaxID=3393430 RepID=UPI003CEB04D4
MDFAETAQEAKLRAEVREVLAAPAVTAALQAVLGSPGEADVRPLYRELGRHGLLAVSWPEAYGGRGARHTEAAAVIEELVHHGVPDMVHVLSIQIVGLFLLQAGSAEQQAALLPALASGERFATVLYTEPEVGSDLASLGTTATRQGDGWSLTGVKVWGLKSTMSDLALCAARTGDGSSRYDGISLFLVDLHADGVRRDQIGSFADDQFDRVEFDGVRLGPETLLGAEGEGWALLNRCLAIERTGLDYSLKAARWFDAALRGLDPGRVDGALLEQVGRQSALVDAGRLLAWEVLSGLDHDRVDAAAAAMSKYHTSETARDVATWAALTHGAGYAGHALSPTDARILESAYREAPGLTLSAGTSEIMLELIANSSFHLHEGS